MAVVRLDKIAGIHLESVQHTADMTNGLFLLLGSMVTNETELYNVVVPTADADLDKEFLLHDTPEVMADPRQAGLKDFLVSAGEQGRAYHMEKGDTITLTDDLIDGATVVGEYAVPQLNSMKLESSADMTTLLTDGVTKHVPSLVFEVVQKTTLGYDASPASVLRVVKA